MDIEKEAHLTDEEEDLEALRLAALQSLKKKSTVSNGYTESNKLTSVQQDSDQLLRQGRLRKGYNGKKGRNFANRGSRNGQFHVSRQRSTNLISITPIANDNEQIYDNANSIFNRSQNRYSNIQNENKDKTDEIMSKFDRYNDSDKSEEESEDFSPKNNSDDNSSPKLGRSDSLEALMQELDDEIHGKAKTKEKDDKCIKTKQKVKKVKESTKTEIDVSEDINNTVQSSVELQEGVKTEEKGDSLLPLSLTDAKSEVTDPQTKKRKPVFSRRRDFLRYKSHRLSPSPQFTNPAINTVSKIPMSFPQGVPVLPIFPNNYGPPNIMIPPPSILFYERPLSPLSINAETLQTQTMAPLSPRSAAFVLENRAIIEKRKRSPRRSYSRSPSPRRRPLNDMRRSLSPWKRSPKRRPNSPIFSVGSPRRRSASPRTRQFSPKSKVNDSPKARLSSPKLRNISPKQRTFSPKRRSNSPRRTDRKETDNSPKNKPSIRERLGYKCTPKSENKEISDKIEPLQNIEEKLVDPILEARKRKFETKEIQFKEGVIRLKPKEEPRTDNLDETKDTEQNKKQDTTLLLKNENNESIKEDIIMEDDEIELESKIDLFSDEESGSENEGRFKTKEQALSKTSVLSFTKLTNGSNEKEYIPKSTNLKRKKVNDRSISRSKTSSQTRPKTDESPKESKKNRLARSSTSVKSDRHEKPKKFDRKIEIKLKNPSKYDKEGKNKNDSRSDEKRHKDIGQKNESNNKKLDDMQIEDDDFETEIIVENEDEIENTNDEDLRAQLSKKRAEKLGKSTSTDRVPSRLLQNALQNALPIKKASSKSKSKELSNSDGKLPIHFRLGTCGSEISKPKRKSRKRKNLEREDQV